MLADDSAGWVFPASSAPRVK